MEIFNPQNIKLTKYLFYTGKGGVGKTSSACATAVALADSGNKVLLVSTVLLQIYRMYSMLI